MSGRPDFSKGYLGAQPKFAEFGLSTVSHDSPEINLEGNEVDVKIKFSKPVKVTANLINCAKEEEQPLHVFTQTRGDIITFPVSLPETGYYKLQLFALPLPDDNKTLPGVYNYLLNCTKITNPATLFPKQFAQWKEGCFIDEPVALGPQSKLKDCHFRAHIPNAKSVAVVADAEWSHLHLNNDGLWEGTVCLDQHKGKDTKVTLNANYGADNKFSTLLEYRI